MTYLKVFAILCLYLNIVISILVQSGVWGKNMKGNVVCVYESIKDQEILKNYASKAKSAVEKYKGVFLVRGGNKITTEGKEFIRTVVIEFETFDKAKKFFYSEE